MHREIRIKLPAYISSRPEKQYRKDFEVYLNPAKEHWNDEIIDYSKKSTEDREDVKVATKTKMYN